MEAAGRTGRMEADGVGIMTAAMTTDVVMIVAMIGDMTMTAGVIAMVETRIIVGKLFQ